MAEPIYKEETIKKLKNRTWILDTCVLIELARCPELYQMFSAMVNDGYKYLITPDVYAELQRGATSLAKRKDYDELLWNLSVRMIRGVDSFCMEEAGARLQLVLSKINSEEKLARNKIVGKNASDCKPSIVDERLLFLATMTLDNTEMLLATENFTDVPMTLYTNEGTITVADEAGIRTIGLYTANMDKIAQMLAKVK